MSRSVSNWVARNDDAAIPDRVKVRVFAKFRGICPKCTRKLQPKKWQCDHITALVNGGKHQEDNLQPLCTTPCHSEKTREDVAEKSRVYRKRAKHLGIFAPRQKIQSAGFRKSTPQRTASRPIERRT